jgi:hypothetical protein
MMGRNDGTRQWMRDLFGAGRPCFSFFSCVWGGEERRELRGPTRRASEAGRERLDKVMKEVAVLLRLSLPISSIAIIPAACFSLLSSPLLSSPPLPFHRRRTLAASSLYRSSALLPRSIVIISLSLLICTC